MKKRLKLKIKMLFEATNLLQKADLNKKRGKL